MNHQFEEETSLLHRVNRNDRSLVIVELAYVKCRPAFIPPLLELVSKNAVIHTLSFSGSSLSNADIISSLASALVVNRTLRKLAIVDCELGSQRLDPRPLFRALEMNSTLAELDVRFNPLFLNEDFSKMLVEQHKRRQNAAAERRARSRALPYDPAALNVSADYGLQVVAIDNLRSDIRTAEQGFYLSTLILQHHVQKHHLQALVQGHLHRICLHQHPFQRNSPLLALTRPIILNFLLGIYPASDTESDQANAPNERGLLGFTRFELMALKNRLYALELRPMLDQHLLPELIDITSSYL
jgi:hypothetical protein